MLFVTE
jgi:hypothetical protein